MADDQTQRQYRSNPLGGRATPTASDQSAANNDPLAELARLIGQNDPFGEYGARGSAQRPSEQAIDWRTTPTEADPYRHDTQAGGDYAAREGYAAEGLPRRAYGGPQPSAAGDLYHSDYRAEATVPGYGDPPPVTEAYEETAYEPGVPPYMTDDQDLYDEPPPPRRRIGILAIAAVVALAVVGTAAAFGYRALFGAAGSGPPPVIKAESTPAKVVPANEKGTQTGKLINDRVNDHAQKIVSREEQPMDIKDEPPGALTQAQSVADAGNAPAPGSGVIGANPRKVHTITIRPDQSAVPGAAQSQAEATPVMPEQAAAAQTMPDHSAASSESSVQPPSPPQAAVPPAHTATPPASARHLANPAHAANAPLSLSPNASAPAPSRMQTATAAPPPRTASRSAVAAHGGYAVQVSSRRSEADAQAAIRSLQRKYANVLTGQPVLVRRVDLGAKGVYYRAMLGPLSNPDAIKLCTRLKAAGGSCFVQRN